MPREDRGGEGQDAGSLLSLLSAYQKVVCYLMGRAVVLFLDQLASVQDSSTLCQGCAMPLFDKLKVAQVQVHLMELTLATTGCLP